ncbi:ferrous iron transport protein B [Succinatimonas hippei]|uniref:Ferrous iron transport protein B n=1 Tax=Succinatimonas hippei (strain DSM 22608 / JCM 16073 / KCTC 15190 / YIT 12066) TaxID=762983 RepID=E8LHH3_SUCHY|nr:ferrous iron transport protein B [Succinatimonas hippei]EFY07992.1 ferrous iron transport protein B [Succinatimonas hippei YIT 12066]
MACQKIALIGNQNSGKTTLFNALTGANQYVGNWPGVTVDKVVGTLKSTDTKVVDLPGLYSLSPYSPEEIVSREYLLSGDYDLIVNVVDAAHLERSLSLTAELLSFNKNIIVALNMMDVAKNNHIEINVNVLEQKLGIKVIPMSASTGDGVQDLVNALNNVPQRQKATIYPQEIKEAVVKIGSYLKDKNDFEKEFISLCLLQNDKVYVHEYMTDELLQVELVKIRAVLEKQYGQDMESKLAGLRYAFVDEAVKASVVKAAANRSKNFSRAVDNIVTNRYLALPIFAVIVYVVYYLAVSTIGTWGTDYANDVIFGEWATNGAAYVLDSISAPEWLSGLIIDGVIGGVGAVLGFVPQMIVLFILLSFLEQCGYMTRVAFVLDRIFRHFGLSGRCFIPMVIASGCAVPAMMASKSIDNINERRITLIATSFIPCSAKLPILAMIAAAFFPDSTIVAPGVYFLAIISVIVTGVILKKESAFKEEVSPFVMELPDYHMPTLGNIARSVYLRCRAFIVKAGTIIFSTVVLVWFLSSFNFTDEGFGMVEVGDSMLAAIGSAIAFIFVPLGFSSWQCAVAIFTGLLAKENVVGTLAVLLGVGADVAEDDATLGVALHGEFSTSAAALSFLAFNLFSTPCIAALGAMKRQLASSKMFSFAIVYLTVWAYVYAFIIYHLGGLIVGQVAFGAGTVVALVLLAAILYLLFRPEKEKPMMGIKVKAV